MEKLALQIGPPPSPNRDKFPFVGTVRIQGLTIDLENLAGSVRKGTGPKGKTWQTKMRYHYGEIRKTTGTDKDKLDVYIGPNPQSKKVFIIHQNHPGNHPKKAGQYDEDKVMLGFNSADEAKRGYLKQYDRKDFFRSITEMSMSQFKKSIFGENKGEKVAAQLIDVTSTPPEYRRPYEDPVQQAQFDARSQFARKLLALAKQNKTASIEPWSEEERRQMATAAPEDVGRSFYTGAGAYQATGSSTDQEAYDRHRRARELTWEAEPGLQEKWTRFMEQNPGFRPQLPQKTAAEIVKEAASSCKTPGKGIKSKGKGRGAAIGGGRGPQGVPVGDKDTLSNKLRRFSRRRKKDNRPSTFIREKMKVGSLREAYDLGAKTAIAAALMPEAPTADKSTPAPGKAASFGVKTTSPMKGAPPPATSGASSGAVQS